MQSEALRLMLELIRCELTGAPLSEAILKELTPAQMQDLYALSKAHDEAHVVACALDRLGLLDGDDPVAEQFQKQQTLAFFRNRQAERETQRIRDLFEELKIPYIPLKGTVLKQHYPAAWMRTGCDVDILVRESELERASRALCDRLGYICDGKIWHDVSMHSPDGLHVELHFALIDQDRFPAVSAILSNVWRDASRVDPEHFLFSLSREHFLLYHVAHTAKHFLIGGCGIRPFWDLWIMETKLGYRIDDHEALLEEAGMLKFARAEHALSEVFSGVREHDELTRRMEDYIVRAGVYGTMESRTLNQMAKKKGKLRFALSRVILPYDVLKRQYPVLEKRPYLMPVMQVRRWIRCLFRRNGRLGELLSTKKEQIRDTASMMERLGI